MKKSKIIGLLSIVFLAFIFYNCASDNDSNPEKLNSVFAKSSPSDIKNVGYIDANSNFVVYNDSITDIVNAWETNLAVKLSSISIQKKVTEYNANETGGLVYYLLIGKTTKGSSVYTEVTNTARGFTLSIESAVTVTCSGCTVGCDASKYVAGGKTLYRCAYPCGECKKTETKTFK